MKYLLYSPLVLLLFAFIRPSEVDKLGPNYTVTRCTPSDTIQQGYSLIQFNFTTDRGSKSMDSIQFSFNGINNILFPSKNGNASLYLKSGKYKFQFYFNSEHYEIYTDSLLIKEQCVTGIKVIFHNSVVPSVTKKPVIYLYPQLTTPVNVKLEVKGELGFTYPKYSESEGWNVVAQPNGQINIGDKFFDYLFWDANVNVNLNTTDLKTGYVVEKDSLTSFLEEQLSEMNLSYREKQDFITFWIPLMMQNENTFVHFLFNEECNSMASLTITPKPDNIFRVQMLWSDATLVSGQQILPQNIQSLNREGFSIVEWGGAEISMTNTTLSTK